MGLMPSAVYTSITQPLLTGDRFLLYTDGIIEATNASGDEFGFERLSDLSRVSGGKSADETVGLILSTVLNWSPKQSDDLTIVVCDYKRTRDE